MKARSTSTQVLINLIKSRITELNELLRSTDHPGQKAIIKTRIGESMDWLMSLGETVEVSK